MHPLGCSVKFHQQVLYLHTRSRKSSGNVLDGFCDFERNDIWQNQFYCRLTHINNRKFLQPLIDIIMNWRWTKGCYSRTWGDVLHIPCIRGFWWHMIICWTPKGQTVCWTSQEGYSVNTMKKHRRPYSPRPWRPAEARINCFKQTWKSKLKTESNLNKQVASLKGPWPRKHAGRKAHRKSFF